MTTRESTIVTTFLDLVVAQRLDDATRLAIRQVEAGGRPQDVIHDLLVPAQTDVGVRWHRATWTAAHEHQATAVADAALHRMVSAVQPRTYRGNLAVLCAEGDWHTLPSRMAAELLRLDGWRVTFLGGPVRAPDLTSWLLQARPEAVIVTCSMPMFGRGVLGIAKAAATLGIPVVAGGHGMGPDNRRAAALGVGWAADLTSLQTVLAGAPVPADPDRYLELLTASGHTALHRQEIIDAALLDLGGAGPIIQSVNPQQLALIAEYLHHLVDVLLAAMLLDDTRVFTEFVAWLAILFSARGIPADMAIMALFALTTATPPELDMAHAILATAMEHIRHTGSL